MKLYKTLLRCLLITCAVGTHATAQQKNLLQDPAKNIKKSLEKQHMKNVKKAAKIGEIIFGSKKLSRMIQSIKWLPKTSFLENSDIGILRDMFTTYLKANLQDIKDNQKELMNIFAEIKKHADKENITKVNNQLKKLDKLVKKNFKKKFSELPNFNKTNIEKQLSNLGISFPKADRSQQDTPKKITSSQLPSPSEVFKGFSKTAGPVLEGIMKGLQIANTMNAFLP